MPRKCKQTKMKTNHSSVCFPSASWEQKNFKFLSLTFSCLPTLNICIFIQCCNTYYSMYVWVNVLDTAFWYNLTCHDHTRLVIFYTYQKNVYLIKMRRRMCLLKWKCKIQCLRTRNKLLFNSFAELLWGQKCFNFFNK